ncbi:MAG TPA: tetraacyldisaccharide 4'-kinase, partial [Syntrophorhabdaceae bacterium]|nr:tetraacyldisaccharide 4'-kinase [Syntrophorhabdaceae bacterium]
PEKDKPLDVGDEPLLLAKKTKVPVLVSDKKYEAIWLGIKDFKIDVAIIDDGFQTRNIRKDMEIVIINETISTKNNNLFPLGPYREPIDSLKRAHAILIKGNNHIGNTDVLTFDVPKYSFRYKPAYIYNLKHNLIGHYNMLKGKRVIAFSGLGDNESFFKTVEGLGCVLVKKLSFPDHYRYSYRDIKKIFRSKNVDFIVTTAKDAVKIADFRLPDNLFYLAIDLEIEKEEELMENILSKIHTYKMFMAYSH